MSECGSNLSSQSSFLPFPSFWWGRNEGLKIIETSSNFYQGTATHATLWVSQSLFDLVVTEISARNKIPIHSLLKIQFCNDVSGHLIYSLRPWVSCVGLYYIAPVLLVENSYGYSTSWLNYERLWQVML